MSFNKRSWCLALAVFCGSIVVQQTCENHAYAQGTPIPPAPPVQTPPGGYSVPPSAGTTGSGQSYGGGMNSVNPPAGQWQKNVPFVLPEERPLPIDLAAALRLANAQAWDVGIAAQQIRVAAAQLTRANVLWLPTLSAGADYMHHSGSVQNTDGSLTSVNRNALELGGAPEMVFNFSDAIFEPLAARQIVKARKADLQTVTNDITFNVAKAYFDVQEARGNLAGTLDTLNQTREMLRRIEKLAPNLVPDLEKYRARAQLSQFEQVEQKAREQWNVASAELARIVRLDPSAVLVPLEPPHLQITLVSPEQPLDNLLPVALAARPELASFQALTQAALKRWREEQFRPALPSVYLRGGTNQLPDSMMFGALTGGPNGSFGNFRARADYEVQVMWELQNLGFGNAAAMRQRRAEYDVTRMQAYRTQDFVAREVAQAFAQVRSARARMSRAEEELRQAELSADLNYKGLGELFRLNATTVALVIRPQEALASMQALLQAYNNYYGTVGDYNRNQFQLYRALGNPAQLLPLLNPENPECGSNPNPAPPPPASPPPPSAANGNPVSPKEVGGEGDRTISTAGAKSSSTPGPTVESISATMIVRVPENAELYCDGVKMTLTGSERNFLSPPLPPGRTYPYEIRIRWMGADGKSVEQTRQVQVQGGQRTTVDFFASNPR
ncbi:MAG TPA: TIGR03000 domain-containing protein [Gemmata sp.]|nr:TIGR03000 domain-containing protein [Gemmata sp.]